MGTQTTSAFQHVRKVFKGLMPESMPGELLPLQDGDTEFGVLSGLAPSFRSMSNGLKLLRHQRLLDETDLSPEQKELFELFESCFWEAAHAQFPEATTCTNISLRLGWRFVHPDDGYRVEFSASLTPEMYQFFGNLTDIMRGQEIYHKIVLCGEMHEGRVVGKVTNPILKQLLNLNGILEEKYLPIISADTDGLHYRFANKPHWQYVQYGLIKDRMEAQLEIMASLVRMAIDDQGFDRQPYEELERDGGIPHLVVNPNLEIVLTGK